jgi:hypothetical protein
MRVDMLTFIVLAMAINAYAQEVYEKKDKFAGNTLYFTKLREPKLEGGGLFLTGRNVSFNFEAMSPVPALVSNPFYVHVETQTRGWIFISAGDSLQLRIDGGEIIRLRGEGSRASREVLSGDTVLESANWEIPLPLIQRIASAKTVDFRILGEKENITGAFKENLFADARGFSEKAPGLLTVAPPKPEEAEALSTATAVSCPIPAGTSRSDNPPKLGVLYGPVTKDVAAILNMAEPKGVIVTSVVNGSVASSIGLKRGDVLLSAGEQPLSDKCDLPRVLATITKGAILPLHIWRDGAESVLQAHF